MGTKWNSLEQLFSVLNEKCNYVVLRNFQYLPEQFRSELHGDIDILTDDVDRIVEIIGAEKFKPQKYRTHYLCEIGEDTVHFDFRFVGDNYYCKNWEEHILNHRIMQKGIYIPNEEDYKYTILYHALIHKTNIASDYVENIEHLFGEKPEQLLGKLKGYLKEHDYRFCQPYDLSVIFNFQRIPVVLTPRRALHRSWMDIKPRIKYKLSRLKNRKKSS